MKAVPLLLTTFVPSIAIEVVRVGWSFLPMNSRSLLITEEMLALETQASDDHVLSADR